MASRSPHGERGLKFRRKTIGLRLVRSLPSRGAWIEINGAPGGDLMVYGRSPHGERGLKYVLL